MTIRWLLTLVFFIAAGVGTAWGLDRILFEVSHDYVYAPGVCLRRSWPGNLVLATFSAAVVTQISGMERIRIHTWLLTLLGSFAAVVLVTVLTATGAGVLAKLSGRHEVLDGLASTPRVVFCSWLVRGAVIGAVCGGITFLSLIDWQADQHDKVQAPGA